MKHIRCLLFLFLSVTIFSSCGILGIHFQVHNPKKAGQLPNFSEEVILLGELTKYRSCFDVHYYDLAVEVFPDQKSLEGRVEVHARAEADFDTLQLDLHPNFEILELKEEGNGKNLSFWRKERAVFIPYSQKKGEHFVLSIRYKGKPHIAEKAPWRGGFVWKKDKAIRIPGSGLHARLRVLVFGGR